MKKIILLTALIIIPSTAHATLFGEVYLGTDNSHISATPTAGPSEDGVNASLLAGLRGGYKYNVFLFGLDVEGTLGTYDVSNSAVKDAAYNKTHIYLLGGLDFKTVRVWGDYGVLDNLTAVQDFGTFKTTKVYSNGTYYKVGVGVRLFKGFGVNGEYYVNTPSSLTVNGTGANFGQSYSKWQETGYIFSLSWFVDEKDIHTAK